MYFINFPMGVIYRGSIRVNTDEIYTSMFHKPLSLFGRGCVMSSLYPATREQTIYGSETRQLSKNACDPNTGKYERGR